MMVFQLDPPTDPREGNISGAAVGASAFADILTGLAFHESASIMPTGSSRKRVAATEDSLAHQVHMVATSGEPIRDGRDVWLAIAPGRLAMVDRTGQVRWSSDSGELTGVQRTDLGLRLDFRDYSVQAIAMSAWTRRRILRAWHHGQS